MEIELKNQQQYDDVFIDYTKQIIKSIKALANEHNSCCAKKVRTQQLIDVFMSGEDLCGQEQELHECCWAKVFLYLNLLKGTTSYASVKHSSSPSFNKKTIDLSANWEPTGAEYEEAKAHINKFNLNFHFTSISQLYFFDKSDIGGYQQYL